MRKLRRFAIGLAALSAVVWGIGALRNLPLIVPADSDLGTGAWKRVEDCRNLFLLSLGLTAVACPFLRWPRLRLGLGVVVLAAVVLVPFASGSLPHTARWPSIALSGLVMVVIAAEARNRSGRPLPPAVLAWLAVFLPALLVFADWRGRIYFGLLPAGSEPYVSGMEPKGRSLPPGPYGNSSSAESSTGRLRADARGDGSVWIENLNGGPARLMVGASSEQRIPQMVFSPDGRTLAVAWEFGPKLGSTVLIWDVAPGGPLKAPSRNLRLELAEDVTQTLSIEFFPDNRVLLAAHGDGTVRFWNATTGEELQRFTPHADDRPDWVRPVLCVAVSPDGQTFATWAWGSIKIWNRESCQLVRELDTRDQHRIWLAYTPDGQSLLAGDYDTVRHWDLHPSWFPFLAPLVLALLALLGLMFAARRASPTNTCAAPEHPATPQLPS